MVVSAGHVSAEKLDVSHNWALMTRGVFSWSCVSTTALWFIWLGLLRLSTGFGTWFWHKAIAFLSFATG